MTEPINEPTPDAVETSRADRDAEPEPSDKVDDSGLDPRVRSAMAKLRHEAATNRVRAKEAEAKVAELEGAVTRLAALEHAEVERIAAEQLHDGADIWRVSPDVQQSWYDEEFRQLQPDKVREATEALIAAKPHLARPQRPPTAQPIEGLRGGASPEQRKPEVTWSSALRRTI